MLYACNVSDLTIADLEGRLEQYRMDDVLAEPPSELRFTKPTEKCPRIPINKLRSMKTINPLTTVDFDAINPKVAIKEDRMWYPILPRSSTEGGEYHQDDPSNMFMCSKCSKDKVAGTEYDQTKRRRYPSIGEASNLPTISEPGRSKLSRCSVIIIQELESMYLTLAQPGWIWKELRTPCTRERGNKFLWKDIKCSERMGTSSTTSIYLSIMETVCTLTTWNCCLLPETWNPSQGVETPKKNFWVIAWGYVLESYELHWCMKGAL